MDPLVREVRDTADGLVRSLHRVGLSLEYDRDGVHAVDGYISSNRALWSEGDRARLAHAIGCFVGECAVAVYGAQWHREGEGEPGVRLSTGDTAFPITKTRKFIDGGDDDSVASFFDVMGAIIAKGGIANL